jgi:acetyl-CoA synthetase
VGEKIDPIAKPDKIRFGNNLLKTRSGKIMHRFTHTLAAQKLLRIFQH